MESVCECSDCSSSQGFPQLRSDAVRTSAKVPQRDKVQSGRFVLLTDIDGIQLLKRLEREIA